MIQIKTRAATIWSMIDILRFVLVELIAQTVFELIGSFKDSKFYFSKEDVKLINPKKLWKIHVNIALGALGTFSLEFLLKLINKIFPTFDETNKAFTKIARQIVI